jgi:small-conductance mechanosensitive channel
MRIWWTILLLLLTTTASISPASAQSPPSAPETTTTAVPEPPPEPVTGTRATQDEAIRSALQAVFDRVPGLSDVAVSVDAGVVRLAGTVLTADTRQRAVDLATAMEGVVFVDVRITESTSLEEKLQPTWNRLRDAGYGVVAKLPLLAVALVMVLGAGWLGTLLARWGGPAFLATRNPFLQALIRRLVQTAVVVAGIILALELLDATAVVGALVGTAGLAGLAVGFAFKDIAENYLAGTLLAIQQPFAKNDLIRVGEFEGKVVRLTPRETILMRLDGNHIRIPNALIFRSPMLNYTRNPLRRVDFELGLGSNDDLLLARRVAVQAMIGMAGVLNEPPPQALITGVGDSTVTMEVQAWVDQRSTDWWRARSEAIRLTKTALESAGLTIPSPEYVVRMEGTTADTSVDETVPQVSAAHSSEIAVDRSLDDQIEVDRQVSGEGDLLDKA